MLIVKQSDTRKERETGCARNRIIAALPIEDRRELLSRGPFARVSISDI